MSDSRRVHLMKTITWRVVATLSTMLILLLMTDNIKLATEVSILNIITNSALYYVHERAWHKLRLREENE